MQDKLQTLLNIPLDVLTNGIVNDIMIILSSLIGIGLIFLGYRLIYSIISNESNQDENINNSNYINEESEENEK